MVRTYSVTLSLCLLLAGCSGVPPVHYGASPCAISEASYECQVIRYQNAP
jgi:starvation-inducible outer membrane lipoprotein